MDTNKKLDGKQQQSVLPIKGEVETLIAQAIDKNVPVETMERLLVMRRELKAEFAKEAFDKAMSEFQAGCPTIGKTKCVYTKAGNKAYSYAPLESIVAQVKGLLKEHGFSYAVQTETKEGMVKVTCIAKHKYGHTEPSSVEVPLGNKTDIMSQTQVVAAALTFAKRYAFCNAFGILTGDEDTDASSMPTDKPDSNKSNKTQGFKNGLAKYTVASSSCPVCHAPKDKVHATNCQTS
jgi:hypothetical protein